ncbi:Ski complex subunit Rec14 [Exophiala xenobiotica]|uniref:Large ribosomal subunit protein bL32m n=1 Tax=Vermiconidia calcicola TaxID=1690605 RepID=A0AAV9QA14_9PEZI|nr:Ski complex subunit Rec14 [Exophiala xenobiotica]KAK5538936.1 Ski complex subunit Rec14 [Vermiconidia calcicola]KAK5540494.1 Ski complex subunit Rec14 [Chaetothyriales sp. CCFEE 6169]KAK5217875.1 Ski complex subunit Rec14 [Exophiala xenobiotica]KAK5266575.1 Ski complex subunit Rec14 [Exophiala xenobiotica]
MALTAAAASTSLSSLFLRRTATRFSTALQSWSSRPLLSASIAIPAIAINIPGLVADIWEGILKAVPKKKTSHRKKRQRQLAGKALKDVKAVVECPGCGRPKKAHTLCPYCVSEIYESWKARDAEQRELASQSKS